MKTKLTNRTVMSVIKKLLDEANAAQAQRFTDEHKLEQLNNEMLGVTVLAHRLGISVGVDENSHYIASWYKSQDEQDDWNSVMHM